MAELIKSLTSVAPKEVQIGKRLRPVKPAGVEAIRASYEQTGVLKDPIGLRKKNDGSLHLIYGLHRLTLALEDGWDSIDCKVWRCTDAWAGMMEIDDNLAGAELDALDTAIFLAERKSVYEKAHPETKRGAKGLISMGSIQTDKMSVWDTTELSSIASFGRVTAEKFGYTDRHIRRMVAAGEALSSDHRDMLRSAPNPVKMADLEAIAKMGANERHKVCLALKNGEAPTAAKAYRQITARPSEEVKSASDTKLKALSDAFARADKKARRQFVAQHLNELQELIAQADTGEVVSFATGRAAE